MSAGEGLGSELLATGDLAGGASDWTGSAPLLERVLSRDLGVTGSFLARGEGGGLKLSWKAAD